MADEPTSPVKPGYKTTEFWLSLAATLLSTLFASGAITNNTVLALAGIGASVLTALGYKVTRTMVKTAGAAVLVLALGASQMSCATVKPRLANGAGALLDCETPDILALVGDLVGIVKPAVMAAITGDGHVDYGHLEATAKEAKSNLARCALATAIAMVVEPVAQASATPQSAPLVVNAFELRTTFAKARASWGVGVIQTSHGAL